MSGPLASPSRFLVISLSLVSLAMGLAPPSGATIVGGTISTNQTWTPAGNPYHVTSNVTIAANVTLTIQARVRVKFDPCLEMTVNGALIAAGTAADSILFTSWKDDYWFDDNGDLGATLPARGDWTRINFLNSASPLGTSAMQYCIVRYGGCLGTGEVSFENNGSLHPTVRECRIELGAGQGIYSHNSAPNVYDCTLQSNGSYAIAVVGSSDLRFRSASEPSLPEDVFRDNAFDAIGAIGAGGAGNNFFGTLRRPGGGKGYPYIIPSAGITLNDAPLIIDPGVVIKMATSSYIDVHADDTIGSGTYLVAAGTPSDSIVFTSLADDAYGGDTDRQAKLPQPGDWDRIWIRGAYADASVLKYCVVRYGGSAGYGNVHCTAEYGGSSHATIRECRIEYGSGPGIRSEGGPLIYDSVIQYNQQYAIYAVGRDDIRYRSAGEPNLPDDVFQFNGCNAVGLLGSGGGAGNQFFGTLRKPGAGHGYPAVIEATGLTLDDTPLVIEPGVVVKMKTGAYLDVMANDNNGAGTYLTAVGSASDSIVITSFADDQYGGNTDQVATVPQPGDWAQIRIRGSYADASLFQYCIVRYGGAGGSGSIYFTSDWGGSHATIRECRIELGAGPGVRSDDSGPKIYDSLIQLNLGRPIDVVGYSDVQFRSASEPGLPEDRFQKNAMDVVGLTNGGNGVFGTWRRPPSGAYPYLLAGSASVAGGRSLSVDPSTVIKVAAGSNVELTCSGTLTMNGTLANPIVMTSLHDDNFLGDTEHNAGAVAAAAGDWLRVHLSGSGATASVLSGVVFAYGAGGGRGHVWCDNTGPAVTPNVQVTSCRFPTSGSPYGVYTTASNPRISNCAFVLTTPAMAVQNATTTIIVDATNCWWGHATGPLDASALPPDQNSAGLGAMVSDYVTYRPWSLSDPVAAPIASVSPEAEDIGVPVGGQGTRTLTISNSGGADLLFSVQEGIGSTMNADDFGSSSYSTQVTDVSWLSVTPSTGRVAAGGSLAVQALFNASGVTQPVSRAYLLFFTNDPSNSYIVVPIEMGLAPLDVPGAASGSPSRLVAYGPSPSTASIRFTVDIAAGDPASMEILDVTGRSIRRYRWDGPGGRQSVSWDGSASTGRPVPAGLYLVRFQTSRGSVVRRIVLAK